MADRVLITGAGRGLGLELARACAARGDRVIGTVRDPATSGDLAGLPGVTVRQLDLRESDGIASTVAAMVDQCGGVDTIINNAGVNFRGVADGSDTLSVETMAAEPMLDLFRINTVAPLLVVRGALPWLRRSPAGRVLNVSSWLASIGGFESGAANYGYRTTKTALVMATRALAAELHPDGIIAVAINPGWMRTEMGGDRATLDPSESAAGIVQIADRATLDDSGRFLDWDGADHPF